MPKNLPETRAIFGREVMYDDKSGVRAGVEYDSHYRLGNNPDHYVRIKAVGGDVVVNMGDVPFLIEALQEVVELDEQTHTSAAKGA